jgi:hypothetical protein
LQARAVLAFARPRCWRRSSVRPTDDSHQFGDLVALVRLVAAGDGALDAMADVIAQDLFLDPPQRGTDRRNLRDDVDAIR